MMSRTSIIALCLIGIFSLFATESFAEPIDASRIRVIAGDTIRLDGHKPNYRLVGFNAPDKGSRARCAAQKALAGPAKHRLGELVARGSLDLDRVPCSCPPGTEGMKRCNQGRYCAILKVDDVNAGLVLIRKGLAAPLVSDVISCPKLPRPWCQ